MVRCFNGNGGFNFFSKPKKLEQKNSRFFPRMCPKNLPGQPRSLRSSDWGLRLIGLLACLRISVLVQELVKYVVQRPRVLLHVVVVKVAGLPLTVNIPATICAISFGRGLLPFLFLDQFLVLPLPLILHRPQVPARVSTFRSRRRLLRMMLANDVLIVHLLVTGWR